MSITLLSNEKHTAEITIEDLVDCQEFAERLASVVQTPLTIGLTGTLGAGKTQWTRYFAMALGAPGNTISSPTFVLVHQYASQPPIFHLDAYRIGDEDEMLDLGIEEMFDSDAITIIEWSDLYPELLPRNTLKIHFEVGDGQTVRHIRMHAVGSRAQSVLGGLIACWS
ncbi:MAG: tRNA (adenosine(37)-N6)-threonylcarbamoyltransferase complex ATPase subunit type 1 TsaE [Pirellula sp.]